MACRVGMTTDPIARKRYWEKEYSTLRNWRLVSKHSAKSEAQAKETILAQKWGCDSGAGGAGPEYATWHVYYFEHDGQ